MARTFLSRTFLKDDVRDKIKPLLPCEKIGNGRPYKPHRPILEGIIWKLRTGAPWRDAPEVLGAWRTIYTRFYSFTRFFRWSRNNAFQSILRLGLIIKRYYSLKNHNRTELKLPYYRLSITPISIF